MKTPFLAVYDYGSGGLWAVISAPDRQSIEDKYPSLTVFDGRPPWMDDFQYDQIAEKNSYDIDDEPKGLLYSVKYELEMPDPKKPKETESI
jgi:hypothetical protein